MKLFFFSCNIYYSNKTCIISFNYFRKFKNYINYINYIINFKIYLTFNRLNDMIFIVIFTFLKQIPTLLAEMKIHVSFFSFEISIF